MKFAEDLKERIKRQKEDYKHSITEENERFVTGVLYGLTMAQAIVDAMPSPTQNGGSNE